MFSLRCKIHGNCLLQIIFGTATLFGITSLQYGELEATPRKRLWELSDSEIFEYEGITCGRIRTGWTTGALLERSGKFRPKLVRLRVLRLRLRAAENRKKRTLRRRIRKKRRAINTENTKCGEVAALLSQPGAASAPGSTSSVPEGQPPSPVSVPTLPPPSGPVSPPQPPVVSASPDVTPPPNPTPEGSGPIPQSPDGETPRLPPGPPVPGPSAVPSLDFLEGFQLYGAMQGPSFTMAPVPDLSNFLGVLSRDTSLKNSLSNPESMYGNSASESSIFNPNHPVGSLNNSVSAFFMFAPFPPFIMDQGRVVGRLTINGIVPNQISSCDVLRWLGRLDEWRSGSIERTRVCP